MNPQRADSLHAEGKVLFSSSPWGLRNYKHAAETCTCVLPPPIYPSISLQCLFIPPIPTFLLSRWSSLSLWFVCPAPVSEARTQSFWLQQRLRVSGKTALRLHPQQQRARVARGEVTPSRHTDTHTLHTNSRRPYSIALENGTY